MKRSIYLFIAFSAIILSACDSTRKKINELAAPFEKAQQERFRNVHKERIASLVEAYKLKETDPIDYKLARMYIHEFRNPLGSGASTSTTTTVDTSRTESIWINKQAIAVMMRTLLSDDSLDGIRIYYARYPSDVSQFDPAVKKPGRQTLVFVCTKNLGTYHQDFYKKVIPSAGMETGDNGLYVYDYNSLCPDSCDGANLGGHGPFPPGQ